MSQKALSDILGTDAVSVNRWEHGNTRPNWEYLKRISKALGVSIDYLLENDDGDFFDAEETGRRFLEPPISSRKKKSSRRNGANSMLLEFLASAAVAGALGYLGNKQNREAAERNRHAALIVDFCNDYVDRAEACFKESERRRWNSKP